MTLAEARAKTAECRRWAAEGRDPKVEMKIRRSKIREAVTVRQALTYWLENHAAYKRTNSDKHLAQFEKHIFPFIGGLPVEELETRHWLSLFNDIRLGKHHKAAPVAAGYIFQNVKHALTYCRKHRFCTSHALDDLTTTDVGERQAKKDRVLSMVEIGDLWHWVHDNKQSWYYRQLIKLLLCFGARTQEIRLSRVDEWDLKAMVWTCPKSHSKNGQEVIRPIPDGLETYIKELIQEAERIDSPYLLGELKQSPAVSSMGAKVCSKLNHDKWNLHDLRRTLATKLSDSGIEPHVIESLLGHTLQGVAGIYNRSQYLEQKRAALDLWYSKLEQREQQLNVVNFK